MNKKYVATFLFVALLFTLTAGARVQSADPEETLRQYVSDLQKNPNDYALREKIVRLAQGIKPAPPIPEEARRHYVIALTLFKGATKVENYGESIGEFRSTLLLAPWWAEANRDLGMALEAAKRYDEATSALKLYIASAPGEEKARAAQDEIYKIEGMKRLTAREKMESSPQVVARKQAEDDYLSGRWKFQGGNECDRASHNEFHLEGNTLIQEMVFDRSCESYRAGSRTEWARYRKVRDKVFQTRNEVMKTDITLEFEGNTIIQTYSGSGSKSFFRRE